ncbi:hypothetical protein [Clostridium ihumii]|uniref:hypothetical protein n=1 Tax=Clostridium ihumii TaxID=1470356 RepID=UPI00058D9971|nr:hypothetical protein [Clostridium ihumii]
MNNKITLTYENSEFVILINDTIVSKGRDLEKSLEKFEQVVKDNSTAQSRSWDSIEESIQELKNSEIEINSEYKTLTFGAMKYFYATGKTFYISKGEMAELKGGYNLFYYIVNLVSSGLLEDYERLLKFCKDILINKSLYNISESSIVVSNPGFNYGSCEYNFVTRKINKGASISKGNLNDFIDYVLEIIK